jgi:hypothetical protein
MMLLQDLDQFLAFFWDISLLVAVIALILLVSSELISSRHGRVNILIDKKRLGNVAIVVTGVFIISVAVRIAAIILRP